MTKNKLRAENCRSKLISKDKYDNRTNILLINNFHSCLIFFGILAVINISYSLIFISIMNSPSYSDRYFESSNE